MTGMVRRVSDGTWPLNTRSRTKCHPVGAAAEIFWNVVPEIEFDASSLIQPLNPKMWNKDKEGVWCKDLGETDYGIIEKDKIPITIILHDSYPGTKMLVNIAS